MPRTTIAMLGWISLPLATIAAVAAIGADAADKPAASPSYALIAKRAAGDRSDVTITFDVGGELVIPTGGAEPKRLPMSVAAEIAYQEQLLSWSPDAAAPSRSVRKYSAVKATIKSGDQGVDRDLPADRRVIVADLGEGDLALSGLEGPLTRQEFDLLDVPANTLALDRLLPGKSLHEGDHWDHDAAAMGPLLGMDNVAVCEVRSVVTGEQNGQVQIRLAGNVQGTIDGATTEMNLRAAYLYHLEEGRITKFNMAIEERREPGDATQGLDVVAKLSLSATRPTGASAAPFDKKTVAAATAFERATLRALAVDAPKRGYRFQHDASWFVTAETRELMSLKLVRGSEMVAFCNISTQPPRPADNPKPLKKFEEEVSTALDDKLEKVEAANEWTTSAGNRCLGIVAQGAVDGAPIEWRYYQVSAKDRPQVTIALTIDQSLVEQLADAEKAIVESMELTAIPTPPAANKPPAETASKPDASVAK